MTIGLLLDDNLDRPDGVQQAVINIGRELTSRGHDVHYIVTETNRFDIQNIHSIGKYISLRFNGNSVRTPLPVSKKSVKKLFSNVNFDVIHVQMPYSPFFAAKVINYAPSNVKIFGTFHILPYGKISNFGNKILGYTLRKSNNRIIKSFAVSEPANQFMFESLGLTGEVLPNPIDYNYFHSFKKQKSTKNRIVFVGRFEQRKGVKELVAAYSRLPVEILNNTELTMCGRGPMYDEIIKYSKSLKLNINFPGFVDDASKAQYLANADIAVFPSISGESFGIVLTEAMSAGAGVTIGGNNPGYSSVLSTWPEILFDPTDIGSFTRLIGKLISDKKLANTIGKDQHLAVIKYDIKNVVDILESNYLDKGV